MGKTDLNPAIRPPTTTTTGASPAFAPSPADAALPADALPKPNDAFGGAQPNLQGFEQGVAPPRSPEELISDLSRLSSAKELAGRFTADLVLGRGGLLEHAALMRADKATRLFQFAVPYAKAALAMSASPQELKLVVADLLKAAEAAGFKDLQLQPEGKNGLVVLKELLKLQSPQAIEQRMAQLKFDAPSWPKDIPRPSETRAKVGAASGEISRSHPAYVPVTGRYAPPVEDAEQSQRARDGERLTNKRLGGRMLWNVLHLFRDDGAEDRDSAAQREAMNQLALVAGLILVFLAVIGVVLATL